MKGIKVFVILFSLILMVNTASAFITIFNHAIEDEDNLFWIDQDSYYYTNVSIPDTINNLYFYLLTPSNDLGPEEGTVTAGVFEHPLKSPVNISWADALGYYTHDTTNYTANDPIIFPFDDIQVTPSTEYAVMVKFDDVGTGKKLWMKNCSTIPDAYQIQKGNENTDYNWIDVSTWASYFNFTSYLTGYSLADVSTLYAENESTHSARIYGYLNSSGASSSADCGFWIAKNDSVGPSAYSLNVSSGTVLNDRAWSSLPATLESGTYYYAKAWAKTAANFTWDSTDTVYFMTKPYAPSDITITTINSSCINLTWTNATVNVDNQSTLVRYSSGGYPTTPSSGSLGYNGTDTWVDINGLNEGVMYYFSLWTYINASGSPYYWWHSEVYNSTANSTGSANISVEILWECNHSGVIDLTNYTIDAMLRNGSVLNHTESPGTNPFYINTSEAPDIIEVTTPEGIERRILYNPGDLSIFIYVPCGEVGWDSGDITPIEIFFVDHSGVFDENHDAIAFLYKYNGTEKYYIHMDYIQADVAMRPWLIVGDTYQVGFGCTEFYIPEKGPLTCMEDEYYINVYNNETDRPYWRQLANVTTGWSDYTLYLDLLDESASISLLELTLYNASGAVIDTETPGLSWDFNYTYSPDDYNTTFYAFVNFTYSGEYGEWTASERVTWPGVYGGDGDTGDDIDDMFTGILGTFPVSYGILFLVFISFIALFTVSPAYAGFGLIIEGFVLAFLKMDIIGLVPHSVLSWEAIGLIIILGILSTIIILKRRQAL